jgi:uncharacterized protein
MNRHSRLHRRSFLRHGVLAAGSVALTPFEALWARAEARGVGPVRSDVGGYGPLAPVADLATGLPLLALPAGFHYTSLGWAGDPLRGGFSPGLHDGMAAFAGSAGIVHLVRNHEIWAERGAFAAGPTYDPLAGGGTTTVAFDTTSWTVVDAWASLVGTHTNCAGGLTPWGSWLTCEEIVKDAGDGAVTCDHGYIFEVPVSGPASAVPLKAMGRFVHEAVAVDPATGIVYETEDKNNCGFYRFVPTQPGSLAAGGKLQMLALTGRRTDLRTFGDSTSCSPRDGLISMIPIRSTPNATASTPRGASKAARSSGGSKARGTATAASTSCPRAAAPSTRGKCGNTHRPLSSCDSCLPRHPSTCSIHPTISA